MATLALDAHGAPGMVGDPGQATVIRQVLDVTEARRAAAERDALLAELRTRNIEPNAYVTWPVEFGEFLIALQQMEAFWLQIVRLPTGPEGARTMPGAR